MKKNEKNRREFFRETRLYVAEPLKKAALAWQNFEDAGKEEKGKMLYFEALSGYELYIAFHRKENKNYAKMYIVSSNYRDVSILYVSSESVNPVKVYYSHNTSKKT